LNAGFEDLFLNSPWLNAAGTLGFSPPRAWRWPASMGAFITNPISALPRSPASNRAALAYPGGLLLHSGHPNPGLAAVLKLNLDRWRRLDVPVWAHLIGEDPAELARMVRRLEEAPDGISVIELGIPPQAQPGEALELARSAAGELPLVVAVPLTAAGEAWLADLKAAGASAVSLTAPRGSLPDREGRRISGRLYGPSLFPLALAALQSAQNCGLPVIASGGVYTLADGECLLQAGALAVQLDTVLWTSSALQRFD